MAEELVSALLDGECSTSEVRRLLDETARSPRLMQQWSRMSLVREAVAGKTVQRSARIDSDQFCAGIMAQLGAMDSAADSVATPAQAMPVPPSKVVALPTRQRPATMQRARRSRPLIGWAAAASVTLVALAGGRAWLGSGTETVATPMASLASNTSDIRPVADTGSNRGGLMPVSARTYTANTEEPTETRWTQLDPDAARELNTYMIEHNNSRADQGMNGALGYARLAARNVDYRSSNGPH
ncbi:MAG: hypothetical protein JWR16_3451 [Nevskia sp.]|nr:hypothetical protein [Nevskia sp.]